MERKKDRENRRVEGYSILTCWDCDQCYIKSKDPYIGYHLCKLLPNQNVEHYANKVNPNCPKTINKQ